MVEGKVVLRKDAPPPTDPVIAGYDLAIISEKFFFRSARLYGLHFTLALSCTHVCPCSVVGSAVGIPSRVLSEFVSRLISDKTL